MIDNNSNQRALFRHSLWGFYAIESGTFSLYPISPFGKRVRMLDRVAEIIGKPLPTTQDSLKSLALVYADFCLSFPSLVNEISLTHPVVSRDGKHSFGDRTYAICRP